MNENSTRNVSHNGRNNNNEQPNWWNARENETGLEVLLSCTKGNRDDYVIIDSEEELSSEEHLQTLKEAVLTCIETNLTSTSQDNEQGEVWNDRLARGKISESIRPKSHKNVVEYGSHEESAKSGHEERLKELFQAIFVVFGENTESKAKTACPAARHGKPAVKHKVMQNMVKNLEMEQSTEPVFSMNKCNKKPLDTESLESLNKRHNSKSLCKVLH